MHDDWLDDELHRSLGREADHGAPEFSVVLEAAEQRVTTDRKQFRFGTAVAVSASMVVLAVTQWPDAPETIDGEYLIAASLMETTQWVAPSDVLMPQHQFDIYRDMPVFTGSTEIEEGTLL